MYKSVSRRKRLPAFRLPAAELQTLFDELEKYDGGKGSSPSFYLKLDDDVRLTFDGLAELLSYKYIPNEIRSMQITQRLSGGSVSINAKDRFYSGDVESDGGNEGWCVGANETVLTFFRRHRPWYSWVAPIPAGWLGFLASMFYLVVTFGLHANVPPVTSGLWSLVILLFATLSWAKGKWLPRFSFVVKETDSVWKRNAVGLGLLIGLGGIVATLVVGMLQMKFS